MVRLKAFSVFNRQLVMETTIISQIRNHFVAILSLMIAIFALVYTTWREELTEKNRNLRTAGFEVLKNLGELQIVVNLNHYLPENQQSNPYLGWGYIALAADLSQLLPPPVPETVNKLVKVWGENWTNIKTNEEAANLISSEIDASRIAVLKSIQSLR